MIKLLDKKEWERKSLIQKMYDDSFYYGYLGKNTLSSSSIKDLYSKPKDYLKNLGKDISHIPAIRIGGLTHTMILEPQKVKSDYFFVDVSTRKTVRFQDAEFENKGKKVMLQSEYDECKVLKDVLDDDMYASHYLTGGEAEVPNIGYIHGIPFRCKADYKKSDLLVDLKTTSNIDEWEYDARYKWHYDIQAYIYTTIFKIPRMVFIIIDKKTLKVDTFEFSQKDLMNASLKLQVAIYNYKMLNEIR